MPEPRERIEPHEGDSRYIRRNEKGQFTEDQTDVGRSISQDMRRESSTQAKPGQGDHGDHHPKPRDENDE